MKLHFSYNVADLTQAIKIAEQTADYADILGVGSLLIFKEGANAVKAFKSAFPNKLIFAEAKITEKSDDVVTMMAQAGANYVSILAGTFNHVIKNAVTTAKSLDIKLVIDLLDAPSYGQSAMDATNLGAHMLILHQAPNQIDQADIATEWHNVRENTNLPIFITGKINESNIQKVIDLRPQGLMIGAALTKSENPATTAQFLRSLI